MCLKYSIIPFTNIFIEKNGSIGMMEYVNSIFSTMLFIIPYSTPKLN